MKKFILPVILLWGVGIGFTGCSNVSKMASNMSSKKAQSHLARNPEQMRIAIEGVVFQPLSRIETPQFQGLQTPLAVGGRQRMESSPRAFSLPRFTAVKILSRNEQTALVQLANGARGYIPSNSVETESAILAGAKPATPNQPYAGIAAVDNSSLYLPTMDTNDAPVDEAMLNNIDSIQLPESEKATEQQPEAQDVDGVILRKPSEASISSNNDGLAKSNQDFSSLP